MPFIFCLLLCLSQSSNASKLYAQTSTHAYWLCKYWPCVFISDRASGKLLKREPILCPQAIQVYQGKVYILSQEKSSCFIILDQKSNVVESVVPLNIDAQDFVLYKGKAYLIYRYLNELFVFDLEKKTGSWVARSEPINSISMYKDKLYLTTNRNTVEIVDPSNLERTFSTIVLRGGVADFHCVKGKGWVIPLGSGVVARRDLETGHIEKLIDVGHLIEDSVILGKDLYLFRNRNAGTTIVDIESGLMVTESWNCYSDSYISDKGVFTHLSFGDQYIMRRIIVQFKDLVLFDTSYTGITGSLWGEGEDEYKEMLDAIKAEDFHKAHEKFHEALGYCHPKAYALAAFAFMKGHLGAEKDIPMGFEFWQHADKDYYEVLCGIAEEDIVSNLTQNGLG